LLRKDGEIMNKGLYDSKLTSYISPREYKTMELINERMKDPAWQRYYATKDVLCTNK